jgi:DNA repair photolyase
MSLELKIGAYSSPRWSFEYLDCAMPMTFDTYGNCAFGCAYCFSAFQRGGGKARAGYENKRSVKSVDPEKVKRMFLEPDKYAGRFAWYIKGRNTLQWGGCRTLLTDTSDISDCLSIC